MTEGLWGSVPVTDVDRREMEKVLAFLDDDLKAHPKPWHEWLAVDGRRCRLPLLEKANLVFARDATERLNRILGFHVEIEPLSIEVTSFGDFARSLPAPAASMVMESPSFGTPALCVLDRNLSSAVVSDAIDGDVFVENREFSRVEKIFLSRTHDALADSMALAWKKVVPRISFQAGRIGSLPGHVLDAPFDEPCLVVGFEAQFLLNAGRVMQVVPKSAIGRHAERLTEQTGEKEGGK